MIETSNDKTRVRLADGDADVWSEFITTQAGKLYGMFMRRWPNRSLAEELVQKTVFDAVRGRLSFDESKGTAEEWLFGIARNNVRLEIRKRAARPSVNGDINSYIGLIGTELLPDEVLERKETAEIVTDALGKLESKEQSVLKAKYIEGLSARQIGEQMSISEKAVHSLLYRARNSLRSELENMAAKEVQK